MKQEGGHNNSSANTLSPEAQTRELGDNCGHEHYFLLECDVHADE
jgi:hypothetical protein